MMKRDWLSIFLPLWVLGSLAWVITGFIMFPIAFRRTLFYSPNAVWTTTLYDLKLVDMEVARALAIVIGPPTVLIVIALTIVAAELIWGNRRERK